MKTLGTILGLFVSFITLALILGLFLWVVAIFWPIIIVLAAIVAMLYVWMATEEDDEDD